MKCTLRMCHPKNHCRNSESWRRREMNTGSQNVSLEEPLLLETRPLKIAIFLDQEDNDLSFYNMTDETHIFSFAQASFLGSLYPYFMRHARDLSPSHSPKRGTQRTQWVAAAACLQTPGLWSSWAGTGNSGWEAPYLRLHEPLWPVSGYQDFQTISRKDSWALHGVTVVNSLSF